VSVSASNLQLREQELSMHRRTIPRSRLLPVAPIFLVDRTRIAEEGGWNSVDSIYAIVKELLWI
jgi:hypothetical protein